MKLLDQNITIEKFGDIATVPEVHMGMELSAKAFNILSDKIYTNKIGAIVRELGANAYDSHVVAGTQLIPFDVQLPTYIEPEFSIRDYGTGMSDEEIRTIYSTYFKSTKTNCNNQVGYLGIGSKTPFCYRDSFQVTSYQNGMKRAYLLYKNKSGLPVLSLASEEETDEPNGLEVRLAVEPKDFKDFQKEVCYFYQYYRVLPKVNTITLTSIIYENNVDNIYYRQQDSYNNATRIIMGQVPYLFYIDKSKFNKIENALLNKPIDIYVDIGDLDIQPSREWIEVDDLANSLIKENLVSAIAQIHSQFDIEADAKPDIVTFYKFLKEASGVYEGIIQSKWRGKEYNITDGINPSGLFTITTYDITKSNYIKKLHTYSDNLNLAYYRDAYIADCVGAISRVASYVKNPFRIIRSDNKDLVNIFCQDYGINLLKASSLPNHRLLKNAVKPPIKGYSLANFHYKIPKAQELDLTNPGVYLIRGKGGIYDSKNCNYSYSNLRYIIRCIANCGIDTHSIYAVSPKTAKNLPITWICLVDYLTTELKNIGGFDDTSLDVAIVYYLDILKKIDKRYKSSLIANTLKELATYKQCDINEGAFKYLCQHIGLALNQTPTLFPNFEILRKKYPLIQPDIDNVDALVEYIEAIDLKG